MVDEAFLQVLERLSPGTPMRQAIDRIIQQGNGALVVLGSGPDVDAVSTGGFRLADAVFMPPKLAELAKMDGAIVLDDGWRSILRANVHLIPDPAIPTDETGSRHRTAERVAIQTGKPVVAVSDDRHVATLFMGGLRHELPTPTDVFAVVNQSLQTLERLRRRLDEAEERLVRLEVADLVSYRAVATVLQRAELVRRVGESIAQRLVGLGEEGHLFRIQLDDLIHGVDELVELVLKDYIRPYRAGRVRRAIAALREIPTSELSDPERVAAAVGIEHPEAPARPRGYRLLARVPRLPEAVRDEIVRHFRGDFQKLLAATVDQLDDVPGVGRARATQLRRFLDRLVESTSLWIPDEL